MRQRPDTVGLSENDICRAFLLLDVSLFSPHFSHLHTEILHHCYNDGPLISNLCFYLTEQLGQHIVTPVCKYSQ